MASRVQCWRTKTTWSGRPGERNAFWPHFVVDPHRLLQSNLRAARIVIGRPCRIDGIQPSNFVAWAKIHNNLYSDEPGLRLLASLNRACRDHVPTFSRASARQPPALWLAARNQETNADDCVEEVLRKAFAKRLPDIRFGCVAHVEQSSGGREVGNRTATFLARVTSRATVLRPLPVFTAMSATNAFKFSF